MAKKLLDFHNLLQPKKIQMKKSFAILMTSVILFSSCGGGEGTAPAGEDSTTRAADSVEQTGDTSAMNSMMGDSTSQSGSHGEGSGSRVGGGVTGGPQKGGSENK